MVLKFWNKNNACFVQRRKNNLLFVQILKNLPINTHTEYYCSEKINIFGC